MNKDDIKTLLQQTVENPQSRPDCPDEYGLASFMDGGLSAHGHEKLVIHLAECAYCIERIGILGRARDEEIDSNVSDLLLARSRKLAANSSSDTNGEAWKHHAPRWAAAAVIVLAVGLLMQPDAPDSTITTPEINQTRNINPISMGPSLLSPLEGMIVVPDDGVFSWTAIASSQYYKVRIVSDEGDLIWEERVTDTRWRLPANLLLTPGAEYYVRVDAFLAESKALNSDYIAFKVGRNQ